MGKQPKTPLQRLDLEPLEPVEDALSLCVRGGRDRPTPLYFQRGTRVVASQVAEIRLCRLLVVLSHVTLSTVIWDSVHIKRGLAADLKAVKALLLEWTVEDEDHSDEAWDAWPHLAEAEPSLERALVAVQKFVFWTAVVARKLMEAEKLSDDFDEMRFRVRMCPHTPGHYPWRWSAVAWMELEAYYDLDSHTAVELSPRMICDQLIHSFVFVPTLDDAQRSMSAFYFNSDRTKEKCVYEITWAEFERFLTEIIHDTIRYSSRTAGSKRLVLRREVPPSVARRQGELREPPKATRR